jgi:hypothetical protein
VGRVSARRKLAAVPRPLRGAAPETVLRDLNVPAQWLSHGRDADLRRRQGAGVRAKPIDVTDVRAPGIRCRWAVEWDAMMVLENGADLASKQCPRHQNIFLIQRKGYQFGSGSYF